MFGNSTVIICSVCDRSCTVLKFAFNGLYFMLKN